ncbi:hypothetical protein FHG89_25970 [Micromonospora orduensis]|uniref:Uncharacterized protein n=1 Tax=Micromonospora orduensis TaxID=1420891 RepID=A0A5C4QGT5_9ACTN|nr:hypothetical protein [Micromonospora orduensis]TNH23960.1 hypothetical protein FHG89_25970 [Micromonospora orduensis]
MDKIDTARVTEVLAYALMDRVAAGPLPVAGEVTVWDVAHEEGDRCFGILLSDGRTFEVALRETAPAPGYVAKEETRPCQECATERRVVREYTTNRATDPTAAYVLDCGHHTIDL